MLRLVMAAAAAGLLLAAPAQAATVVQNQSFNLFHIENRSLTSQGGWPFLQFNATDSRNLSFLGFDSTLGTLKNATLAITSKKELGVGVFIPRHGGAVLDGKMHTDVHVAGANLGGTAVDVLVACGSVAGQGCLTADKDKFQFDVNYALTELAALQTGANVDVGLFSIFNLELSTVVLFGDLFGTATQQWGGDVVLTYEYDPRAIPGAVPEPTTWALMILGFGLAGTALRQRRREARPA